MRALLKRALIALFMAVTMLFIVVFSGTVVFIVATFMQRGT